MKACGLIVEYNPFHNGHLYHVQKARELSQAEIIVAIMSGNFLQRGEPAMIDKWQRARAALANGVDLVVELPVEWAVQAADYFAYGGIQILSALGCQSVCFGTDATSSFNYNEFGEQYHAQKEKIDAMFKQTDSKNLSYSQKMTQILPVFFPQLGTGKFSPNHILGMSYAYQNAHLTKPMELIALPRKNSQYHSLEMVGDIASATAIRQGLRQGLDVSQVVPAATQKAIKDYTVDWSDYWTILRYKIISSSVSELKEMYQMTEGLEYRLKKYILEATSWSHYLSLLQTKRYTKTRIQRLLCYVLLNIKTTEMTQAWQQKSIQLLGFTPAGKKYLKTIKKESSLPIISKVDAKIVENYPLMIRSNQIYQMGHSNIPEQIFGRFPIQ